MNLLSGHDRNLKRRRRHLSQEIRLATNVLNSSAVWSLISLMRSGRSTRCIGRNSPGNPPGIPTRYLMWSADRRSRFFPLEHVRPTPAIQICLSKFTPLTEEHYSYILYIVSIIRTLPCTGTAGSMIVSGYYLIFWPGFIETSQTTVLFNWFSNTFSTFCKIIIIILFNSLSLVG